MSRSAQAMKQAQAEWDNAQEPDDEPVEHDCDEDGCRMQITSRSRRGISYQCSVCGKQDCDPFD